MEAKSPVNRMNVIQEVIKNIERVPSVNFIWFNWKTMLSQYFTVPLKYSISQYHEYLLYYNIPGVMKSESFSGSISTESFNLINLGK